MSARLPTAAFAVLALAAAALPAVALAKFTSTPTATTTLSSGPLAPTGVGDKCNGSKLVVSWSAPEGFPPTSYTVWVASNGKEPYVESKTVVGTQLSAELSLGGSTYAPAVTATYGTWKSPLSSPGAKLKC